MIPQTLQSFRRQSLLSLTFTDRTFQKELLGQRSDIFRSIPQGRNHNAVLLAQTQKFAIELAFVGQLVEISMGTDHDPHTN